MNKIVIFIFFILNFPLVFFSQYFVYNPVGSGLGDQSINNNAQAIEVDPGWSSVIVYDGGGSSGNYAAYANNMVTFYTLDASKKWKITCNSFETESGYDYFYIYKTLCSFENSKIY